VIKTLRFRSVPWYKSPFRDSFKNWEFVGFWSSLENWASLGRALKTEHFLGELEKWALREASKYERFLEELQKQRSIGGASETEPFLEESQNMSVSSRSSEIWANLGGAFKTADGERFLEQHQKQRSIGRASETEHFLEESQNMSVSSKSFKIWAFLGGASKYDRFLGDLYFFHCLTEVLVYTCDLIRYHGPSQWRKPWGGKMQISRNTFSK